MAGKGYSPVDNMMVIIQLKQKNKNNVKQINILTSSLAIRGSMFLLFFNAKKMVTLANWQTLSKLNDAFLTHFSL